MTLYKYIAKDQDGKIYERTVEAKSRLDIYGIIRQEGGTVVTVKETSHFMPGLSFNNLFGSIKTQEKINFAKNLGLMMEAGLPLVRALAVMGKQTRNLSLKKLLSELEEDVRAGKTLSESLGKRPKIFSTLFVSMVKAGEESGKVSQALSMVASQMEKSHSLAKKVRGAMIYPAIIIAIMIILAVLLLMFMVPTLTATFEGIGAKLPLSTRMMIYLSSFLVDHTLFVVSAFIFIVASVILFAKSSAGRRLADTIFLRLPIIGEMTREFESARTTRTLSSLLSSGVEIVVAMDVTTDVVQNHFYKKALLSAKAAVEKGEPMSGIFMEYDRLYPPFVGEMVLVGEETGRIADMLSGVADYYENEVDQKTKNLSTIIEPVLMVIIGAGVGMFAISMLAPTYSLVDYIQ